jgi:hypothetical protein
MKIIKKLKTNFSNFISIHFDFFFFYLPTFLTLVFPTFFSFLIFLSNKSFENLDLDVDVFGFSVQKSSSAVEPTVEKLKRPLTAKELAALEFRKKFDDYMNDTQTPEQKRLRRDREAIEFANRELNKVQKRKF